MQDAGAITQGQATDLSKRYETEGAVDPVKVAKANALRDAFSTIDAKVSGQANIKGIESALGLGGAFTLKGGTILDESKYKEYQTGALKGTAENKNIQEFLEKSGAEIHRARRDPTAGIGTGPQADPGAVNELTGAAIGEFNTKVKALAAAINSATTLISAYTAEMKKRQ